MDCAPGGGCVCNVPDICKQSSFHQPRASLQRRCKWELLATQHLQLDYIAQHLQLDVGAPAP